MGPRVIFQVKDQAPGYVAVRRSQDGRGAWEYFDARTLAYTADEARELAANAPAEINQMDPVVRIAKIQVIECTGGDH